MSGLTFASPDWLWGLILLLPLVGLRIRSHRNTAAQLPGLVSPRLSGRLVSGESRSRRWTVFSLRCLALAATLVALARPQMGFTEADTEIDARNLIIAIDTSRSMLAEDTPPNRLERAKLAAKDIVYSFPEDRIGLIAFAGRPFAQAPLTVDHEAVIEAIDQLDTDIIPRGGTNLSAAAALALENFLEADVKRSALIILSDGEAHEGIDEIERIRDRSAEMGMAILSIGVGTVEGSIIPETDANGAPIPGVFVKDEDGQVVRTRLVEDGLQSLSGRDGIYVQLGGQATLTRVVNQIRSAISTSRESSETRLRPIERFLWPLGAAILLLVVSQLLSLTRQSWSSARRNPGSVSVRRLAALLAFLLLPSGSLLANEDSQIGHAAFSREDYPAAIEAYERSLSRRTTAPDRAHVHMGIGAAAYRMEHFEKAAEAYGSALIDGDGRLRADAHYNLGNTLFRKGELGLSSIGARRDPDQVQSLVDPETTVDGTIRDWEGSLEHFETALSLDPNHSQAAHNLEVVRRRLEDLKQEREKEEQKDQSEEEKETEEEKEEEQPQEPEPEKPEDNEEEDEPKDESPEDPEGDEPKDDEGESPGDDPQKPEGEGSGDTPPDKPPGDPENEGKDDGSEPPGDPDPGKGDPPGNDPPDPPGGQEPEQPDAPQDGELKANPNQSQPPPGTPGEASAAATSPINPETGYSPSDARQLLEALADETEVRPIIEPSRGERFKNW